MEDSRFHSSTQHNFMEHPYVVLESKMATHSSILAWRIPWIWATVRGDAKSQTQMKWLSMHYIVHTMWKKESEVAQSCPTLCDTMDCSLPGFHGIFQARVPGWVVISFSRGSSQPRDRTQVCRTAGRGFTLWATREAHILCKHDR